jgi:hypothetical protein
MVSHRLRFPVWSKSVIGSVLRPSTGGGDLYMRGQLMTGGINVGLVSSRSVAVRDLQAIAGAFLRIA